jgi:16S rRNA processing protein RimM
MNDLICLGQIVAAHGIKGQVKIKVFTIYPENLNQYGVLINKNNEPIEIINLAVKSPTSVVASIKGITTRNQAETLKGTQLFIHEDQLPPLSDDEVYYEQLVGLPLVANDKTLGEVVGVFDFGAGAFCEVRATDGKIGTIHLSSCTLLDDKLTCEEEHFLI